MTYLQIRKKKDRNYYQFYYKEARKRYYQSHKKERLEYAKKYRVTEKGKLVRKKAYEKSIKKRIEIVNKIKKGKECVDCGIKDFRVLDFDHIKDKKQGISEMCIRNIKYIEIMKEIEKCEVRCSNCHRIKHYEERKLKVEITNQIK